MIAKTDQLKSIHIKIDKSGRVVIPQEVREELHLQPGTTLALELETDNSIVLKVVQEEAEIVYENGIPVFKGELLEPNLDIVEFIKKNREERAQQIWDRSLGK